DEAAGVAMGAARGGAALCQRVGRRAGAGPGGGGVAVAVAAGGDPGRRGGGAALRPAGGYLSRLARPVVAAAIVAVPGGGAGAQDRGAAAGCGDLRHAGAAG